MPKNQTLDEFYSTFREEVLCASDTETSGWTTEDFLTNVMMEYLEEAGEVTNPVICPFRGYGLQMNAYAISEDCESVDIFVSIYSESDRPRSVSQADIDAAIKRAIQLYHKAINDLYTAFQKDNDTYEFAITLHQNKDNIKHVRICALTNGLVKPIALKNITIGDAEISFSLWDVDRLVLLSGVVIINATSRPRICRCLLWMNLFMKRPPHCCWVPWISSQCFRSARMRRKYSVMKTG